MKKTVALILTSVLFIVGLIPFTSASAAPFIGNGTPASCNEPALDAALQNGGDIVFNCGTQPVTIYFTSTKIISVDTHIDGNKRVTFSGSDKRRLFVVNEGIALTLSELTVSDGKVGADDEDGNGGAILNKGGSLTLMDAMISGSAAEGKGGAVYSEGGDVKIDRAALFNNKSKLAGAALYFDKGNVELANVTISGNTSGAEGGGIYNREAIVHVTHVTMFNNKSEKMAQDIFTGEKGKLTLMNTIISNPKPKANEPVVTNCAGVVDDGGNNLQYPDSSCGTAINVTNPMLAPLGNYGGYPQTHALKSGSPAIDAANSTPCSDDPVDRLDARKLGRPSGGACDIGAYEFVIGAAPVVPPTAEPPAPSNPGNPGPQPTKPIIIIQIPTPIIIIKLPTPCPPGYQGDPIHGVSCLPIPR